MPMLTSVSRLKCTNECVHLRASTDANVPIGLGIPALAIDGGGRGDGAHSLSEWYEDGDRGYLGPQWALLIALAATAR